MRVELKPKERICTACSIAAHDHCVCECEICSHRFDHLTRAQVLAEICDWLRNDMRGVDANYDDAGDVLAAAIEVKFGSRHD